MKFFSFCTLLFFSARFQIDAFHHRQIPVVPLRKHLSNHSPVHRLFASTSDESSENKITLKFPAKIDKNDRKALVSAAAFCVIDIAAKAGFKALEINFPSSLAACGALFASLLALPSENADKLFDKLNPGAKLLAKWLPVFFVPSLVILPLAKGFGSPSDLVKVMIVLVGGFLFSLLTTAWSVVGVRRLKSSSEEAQASEFVEDVKDVASSSYNAAKESVQDKLEVKPFSDELFNLLGIFTLVTGAGGLLFESTALKPLFMLSTTLFSFVTGARFPNKIKKLIHPLVTCTALTWTALIGFGKLSGSSFLNVLKGYKVGSIRPSAFGAGDVLLFLLGPAVISLAISMYEKRKLMRQNLAEVGTAIGVSTFGGLFGTAIMVRFLQIASPILRLSLLSRNITSPLAMAIAGLVGGDVSLAVSAVVVTGLFGANFGASILDMAGIKDAVARGLGIGAAAHGLGTAAFANEEEAFPFAAIAMALTASAATITVSIPLFRRLLLHLALA